MRRILINGTTDNVLAYGWGSLMAVTSLLVASQATQIMVVLALNLLVPIITKLCMRAIDSWFERRKQLKDLEKTQ